MGQGPLLAIGDVVCVNALDGIEELGILGAVCVSVRVTQGCSPRGRWGVM